MGVTAVRRGKRAAPRLPVLLVALLIVVGAGWAIAVLLLHNQATGQTAPSNITWLAGPAQAASGFQLHNQFGQSVTLADLRGKAVVLTFLTAACHQDCPLIGQQLARTDTMLAGAERRHTIYVAISVAPPDGVPRGIAADTPAEITHFTQTAGLEGIARQKRFLFLTGTQASLAPIWKSYNIGVIVPTAVPTGVNADADVAHTSVLYFIGPDGTLRGLSSFPFLAADVAQGINHLLN